MADQGGLALKGALLVLLANLGGAGGLLKLCILSLDAAGVAKPARSLACIMKEKAQSGHIADNA